MKKRRSDRVHGLQRWEAWLEGRLSPHGVVREDPEDVETDDAVWRIGFRDDTRARVHVTARALRLTEEEFDEVVDELEARGWIGLVRAVQPGGIRIQADCRIEKLGPEGAERSRVEE